MLFREIVGHQDIKERLIQGVKDKRISHAQLFLGPEGSGKLALAIAYAQYISCTNQQEHDSCGECPSCKKFVKLIHPDLHFVYPVVASTKFPKPVSDNYLNEWRDYILSSNYHKYEHWQQTISSDNKQAGIFVHESPAILRKLNLKTYEAEYKTMIIWFPEKMNEMCANKLLKLLEEPPEKTLFLLVTENSQEIIRTILSRTQLLKIPKIDNESLKKGLAEKHHLPANELEYIVRVANGNFVKAEEMISENEDNTLYFTMFTSLMRNCYAYNVLEIQKWVDSIASWGREKQKFFLVYALKMIRENIVLNQVPTEKQQLNYLSEKELDFSSKFSAFITLNNVQMIADEFDKACFHIERNVFSKLVLLDLALKLMPMLRRFQ